MNHHNRPTLLLNAAILAGFGLASSLSTCLPVLAQGSPVPGSSGSSAEAGSTYGSYNSYQTLSGGSSPSTSALAPAGGSSAPVPGAGRSLPLSAAAAAVGGRASTPGSKYRDLPLTVDSTKYRLDELRAMLAVSRPQDMQDSVQELCEWLNDAADAHYRMYLSFAKSDQTKAQANSEKQLNLRFGQLKREAQLLRADLLIKQLRAPEALSPLVDIVVADPRSSTGQNAYKRLVELGFSQGVAAPEATPASSASATSGAATSLITGTAPVMAPVNVPASLTTTAPVKAPATAPVKTLATAPVSAPSAAPAKAPVKVQAANPGSKATH